MTFDLGQRILDREISSTLSKRKAYRDLYGNQNLVKDLDIINELDGHSGCVNALAWSTSGRLLASGSDDQHLNIHAYQHDGNQKQFQLQTTVATGHTQNIFSVKFMPHSNDRTVITCAGDGDVRVFDLEYSGTATEASAASSRAAAGRRARRNNAYNGVRYLSDGDTNARVYRSHGDRVKRIVTESSPYLFLTCSEDGEVRQWDTRQPSSAYPRPRNGRYTGVDDNVPPPLISYQHYNLDLNTISCSAASPHYIALGGAHLHCFLHDRRMVGRDKLRESGRSARIRSQHNDALMNQATRCVRKFAPQGQAKMSSQERGHITACKISDARPDEIVVSWSGDHIYSFDLVRSPDADEQGSRPASVSSSANARAVNDRGVKRKRKNKDSSTTHIDDATALRIRYNNGQQEDLQLADEQVASLTPEQAEARRLATAILALSQTFFDRNADDKTYTKTLGQCAAILPDIDHVLQSWPYPVDPSSDALRTQQELRKVREALRRFVQAVGAISRVLGGKLQTTSASRHLLDRFVTIDNRATEKHMDNHEKFTYDYIKAILAWLDSGHGKLIEAFTRPADMSSTAVKAQRLPIAANEATSAAVDEVLVPYLHTLARNADDVPILNLEHNRFETDESRKLYANRSEAVDALSEAISQPFADLAGHESATGLRRHDAISFWAQKVARSVLHQAYQRIDLRMAEIALGGVSMMQNPDLEHAVETSSPQDDNVQEIEFIQMEDFAGNIDNGSAPLDVAAESDDEDESDDDEHEDDDDELEFEADEDDEMLEMDEDESSEADEEDGVPNLGLPRYMYRHVAEQERRRHRTEVAANVPCNAATRTYKGHCNVKTVKDVNYFGLEDEYVVSGSDDGNLFIWDRKTSKLVNILEGDGEVVNVVQGHPYETMLAVSGIDHTIKIFSPHNHAREIARLGEQVSAHDPSTFSSLAWPSRITSRTPRTRTTSQSMRNVSAPEDDDYIAEAGLASRQRWHEAQQIVERNERGRRHGDDDAVITRSMIQALAQRMREHRAAQGGDPALPLEGLETMEDEDGRVRVVLGDDCTLM